MIKHDFTQAGLMTKAMAYSDDELARQIAATECVITYLEGRHDCQLMLVPLRIELDVLRSFASERKLNYGKYNFFKHD